MIINTTSICYDLLTVQLDDGFLDFSWSIDTDAIKSLLENQGINKILDFSNNIDFDIEVDNVDTFDSINLKHYKFSELEQTYKGNIVYSAILPFNKNKFEETNYYIRVKLSNAETTYTVISDQLEQINIEFEDTWSNGLPFTIHKNYTKDLIDIMYRTAADFNAYNKEAKSANFYYIFQACAYVLNEQYKYVIDEKNSFLLNRSLPDDLINSFGTLFKFDDATNLSMEEYRRIIRNLIAAYQHGGAWTYIKNTLKYLIGYTPELSNFKNFCPWILRKAEIVGYDTNNNPIYNWNRPDPENFSDRNYYNPDSNYYIFSTEFGQATNKNLAMLSTEYERLFTFIVKSNNFFNIDVDEEKIKTILNLLKSAYTKYTLSIENKIESSESD